MFAALTCAPVAPRENLWLRLRKPEETISCTFSHQQYSSPGLFLIARERLTSSGYLKDDSFTVRCTVAAVVDQQRRAGFLADVAAPSPNLHRQLGELLKSQKGADVRFVVSGESFLAHRNILAARSPVLMAEFFGKLKENSSAPQCVEIEDMEPSVFEALLHYIYTDTLPQVRRARSAARGGNHDGAAFTCGCRSVWTGEAEDDMRRKLCRSINVETVATTLVLAEQHISQLKARCVGFIVSSPANLAAVVATEGYRDLMESCPALLYHLLKVAVHARHK